MKQNTFSAHDLAVACLQATSATTTAGEQARLLASAVASATKGKRGDGRIKAATAVLSPARKELATELDKLKLDGKSVTTSEDSRRILNTFRVALKRAIERDCRMSVSFGLKNVTVKPAAKKKDPGGKKKTPPKDPEGKGKGDESLPLKTPGERREAALRALDSEAKAFVHSCVEKAGMIEAQARAEWLEAVEGWLEAAKLAADSEKKAEKRARKGKAPKAING